MPPKKLVIKEDGSPNFNALQSVMSSQIAADAKYDRENDAKFRAVKQKVATYEEFENIVLGAHLQPMEDDILDLDMKKTQKSSTGRARDRERERMKQSAAAAASTGPASGGCEDQDPPKTSQEFTRRWRSLKADPTARCRYLLLAGPKRLSKFFGSGADAILGDALIALDTGFASNDSAQMLAILDALAKTDRITLAIEFLSAAEREAAVNALGRIESAGGTTTPSAVDGDAVVPESAGEDKGATAAPVDLDIVARLQALFL